MGYTTATLVEYELRAGDSFASNTTPSLEAVTSWIEEESAQIDQEAGTSFGQLTSTEVLDWDREEPLQDALYTRYTPIISITKLEYNPKSIYDDEYATSWEEKTEDEDFTVYNDKGKIEVLYPKFKPESGRKRFRITYTHGNATTPPVVQKLATKAVALRVLDSLLHSKVEDSETGGSIGVGSISIVDPTDYGISGLKKLKEDVQELKKKLLEGLVVFRYGDY